MEFVTIRIPPRKAGADAVVEWYAWKDGARPADPDATSKISAVDLNGTLSPDKVQGHFTSETGESDQFALDGRSLFDSMFAGDLTVKWSAATQLAANDEEVRVFLQVEDAELARLPWELMTDDDGPLFLRPNPLVIRWRNPSVNVSDKSTPWPIRVLVVVGCSEKQAVAIGVDQELRAIRRTLHCVDHSFDLEVLDARFKRCNRTEVMKAITKFDPHVLHFIGHATSDVKNAALKLWDKDARGGTTEDWPAGELKVTLQQQKKRSLRLVYLNACRTQDAAKESVTASTLADAFLKLGVPAVIAMQADVHGDAAQLVAAEFYDQLAKGQTVDVAVEAGRARLLTVAGVDMKTRNPFCAVLTIQRPPEQVLKFRSLVGAKEKKQIEQCAILKPVRQLFVNQSPLRRDLITAFFSPATDDELSAAVVRGAKSAGKSWLAKWMLAVGAFQKCGVRYVEARKHSDWLALMRSVVSDEQSGQYVAQRLPQKARDYFYWTLKHVAAGQSVPPGDPPNNVNDDGLTLSQCIAKDNDAVSKIMAAFLEALKIAADGQYFILVADHWQPDADHGTAVVTMADLKTHLWDRIAEDHQSPVKLLLIPPPPDPKDAAAADEPYPTAHWKHVNLDNVPPDEAAGLLLELYALRFGGAEPSDDERQAFRVKRAMLMKQLDDYALAIKGALGKP
jgi:hypothetical protein